jgi:uncharacterized glyoxalase superfamily protein PhnB
MRVNRSIPDATVIPELACEDVGAAAAWLGEAFGFGVRLRIGDHRIQMSVGGGAVVLVDGGPGPGRVLGRVAHVDAHHERARAAGARILAPPADHPYGERQYSVEDPAGHRWTFSQTIADVDPRDWGGEVGEG